MKATAKVSAVFFGYFLQVCPHQTRKSKKQNIFDRSWHPLFPFSEDHTIINCSKFLPCDYFCQLVQISALTELRCTPWPWWTYPSYLTMNCSLVSTRVYSLLRALRTRSKAKCDILKWPISGKKKNSHFSSVFSTFDAVGLKSAIM